MSFELTWEPCGVYRRYWGDVSMAERRRSLELICADPRFDDLHYVITSYLDVDSCDISPAANKEIAALHIGPSRTNPRIRIAAVVTDARIIQSIEHFIGLEMTSLPYCIFPSVAAAREWVSRASGPAANRSFRL